MEKKYFLVHGLDTSGKEKRKINYLNKELSSLMAFQDGSGARSNQGQLQIKIEIRIFWRCGPPGNRSAKLLMSLI